MNDDGGGGGGGGAILLMYSRYKNDFTPLKLLYLRRRKFFFRNRCVETFSVRNSIKTRLKRPTSVIRKTNFSPRINEISFRINTPDHF